MCFSVYCLYTGYFLLHMYLENSNIMTSILLLYIYIHVYPCIYIYIHDVTISHTICNIH